MGAREWPKGQDCPRLGTQTSERNPIIPVIPGWSRPSIRRMGARPNDPGPSRLAGAFSRCPPRPPGRHRCPPPFPPPPALALGLSCRCLRGAAAAQQQGRPPDRPGWIRRPARPPRPPAPRKPPGAADQASPVPRGKPGAQQARRAGLTSRRAMAARRHGTRPAGRPAGAGRGRPAESRRNAGARPKRAAALERPPAREALRRHAHHPLPPCRDAGGRRAGARSAAALPSAAAAARALTASYLATVSASDDTMVGAATQYYATRVRFYGRPITTAGLARREAQLRPALARAALRAAGDACRLRCRDLHDPHDRRFPHGQPGRGAVSSGEAELILEVGFAGTRPYILGETGRVLRRSIQAGTLAPSPGKA